MCEEVTGLESKTSSRNTVSDISGVVVGGGGLGSRLSMYALACCGPGL